MAKLKKCEHLITYIIITIFLLSQAGCAVKELGKPTEGGTPKKARVSEKPNPTEEKVLSSPFFISAEYFRKTARKGGKKKIQLFGESKQNEELEKRIERLEERLKGLPYRAKNPSGVPILRRKVVLLSLLGDLGLDVLTRLPEALRKTDGVVPVDASSLSRLLEQEGLTVADLAKTSARRHIANLAGIQAYILVYFPNGSPMQKKKSVLRIDVIHAVESVLIGSYLGTIDDFDSIAPRISADIVRATEWSCRVIKVEKDAVYINAGRLTGLQPGDRFQVFSRGKEIWDPVTKRSLGFAPGQLKGIIEVETLFGTDAAKAKIISGTGFKIGDQVKILKLA